MKTELFQFRKNCFVLKAKWGYDKTIISWFQPTPPWKAESNIGASMQNNTFPIPPRNNDLVKSTNYEWKKAGTNANDNFTGGNNAMQNGGSFNSSAGGYAGGYAGANSTFQTNNAGNTFLHYGKVYTLFPHGFSPPPLVKGGLNSLEF